jgi:diguanylate cyclase
MEYEQDYAQAQEVARLVLPLMARLEIPVTPLNYALWYEYQLGRSQELVAALDKIESGQQAYDAAQARQLFLRYVATPGIETLEKVEGEVCRLLADIVQIVIDAGLDLTKYSAVLESCTSRLKSVDDVRDIRNVVRELLSDTQHMSQSNHDVTASLKAHSAEIDKLRAELDRVRQEAIRDPLTGLANRRSFDDQLAASLDQALQQLKSICLLMIDIDHFKQINDEHGHRIGDKVLQYVAGVLKANFKGKDLVARYGGDEFAVIIENAPRAGVNAVAETVRRQIEASRLKRTDTGKALGTVSVSIGYECVQRGDSPDALVERADKALYEAKQQGRNRVLGYQN